MMMRRGVKNLGKSGYVTAAIRLQTFLIFTLINGI